jgi:Protein of unknown function (DUF3168)
MSGASEIELHRAVIAALIADSIVASLCGGRVIEWPDAKTKFPCVTVQRAETQEADAAGFEGADATITINAWAKGTRATADAAALGVAVYNVLHRRPDALAMPSHVAVTCTRGYSQTLRDDASSAELKGDVARNISRYRILTTANAMRLGVV